MNWYDFVLLWVNLLEVCSCNCHVNLKFKKLQKVSVREKKHTKLNLTIRVISSIFHCQFIICFQFPYSLFSRIKFEKKLEKIIRKIGKTNYYVAKYKIYLDFSSVSFIVLISDFIMSSICTFLSYFFAKFENEFLHVYFFVQWSYWCFTVNVRYIDDGKWEFKLKLNLVCLLD